MEDKKIEGKLSVTDKIGIGPEDPIAQLHISSSADAPSQAFLQSGQVLLTLSVDASGAKLGTDYAFPLSLLTNGSSRMAIDAAGNVGIGTTSTLTEKLTVNGNIKSISFLGNGATLDGIVKKAGDTMTGSLTVQNNLTVTGNVGIGTNQPQGKLDVQGDIRAGNSDIYLTKTDHDYTGIGNTAGFAAIENAVNYDALMILGRAGTSKGRSVKLWDYLQVNGDLEVTGNITVGNGIVTGNVGIGTNEPQGKLDVRGDIRAGNSDIYFTKTDHNHTGISNTAGFAAIENAVNYDALMILGRAGTSQGRSVKLWDYLQVNGGLEVTGNITVGNGLKINGDFELPNTVGQFARFTNKKFYNESHFKNNNVKLSLGSYDDTQIPNREYELAIGHTQRLFVAPATKFYAVFAKQFSINNSGDLYCAGSKAGFVADYFVNRVGDTLEQGDVVVISEYQVSHYSGTQNNIPILEVDLTDRACDTRVCGIVAKFVTEQDLPFVEVAPDSETPPPELIEQLMSEATENSESYTHPLKSFASEFKEDADPNKVQDQQMGLMVTLGAFSHCKVDADIAPIAVGDLLTTSPTRGHAQKVLEPEKAVGSIVGKALASLEKGKGKIPVLVMLQ